MAVAEGIGIVTFQLETIVLLLAVDISGEATTTVERLYHVGGQR